MRKWRTARDSENPRPRSVERRVGGTAPGEMAAAHDAPIDLAAQAVLLRGLATRALPAQDTARGFPASPATIQPSVRGLDRRRRFTPLSDWRVAPRVGLAGGCALQVLTCEARGTARGRDLRRQRRRFSRPRTPPRRRSNREWGLPNKSRRTPSPSNVPALATAQKPQPENRNHTRQNPKGVRQRNPKMKLRRLASSISRRSPIPRPHPSVGWRWKAPAQNFWRKTIDPWI